MLMSSGSVDLELDGTGVRLAVGKIHHQFVSLPKYKIALYMRDEFYTRKFWKLGRLYRGYVGLYCFIGRIHFDLWIHNMQK